MGKPERQKILRRARRRLEDNIKMDLKGIGGRAWPGLICLQAEKSGGFL